MNNILVTGGAGYIGSQVCKELSLHGFTPIVIDNFSTGHRHNIKWGPFYKVDLLDSNSLLEIVRHEKIFGVIHLAASAYVEESETDPLKYYENNLVSTINVLRLVEEMQIKNLVFSSTCAVYGNEHNSPITEDNESVPVNNYGLSKKYCEEVIRSVSSTTELRSAILRFFNVAGSDLEGELFEEHVPEPHVIPSFLCAVRNGSKLRVFGDSYETADGSCVRDFVHVVDIARAHVLALKYLASNGISTILNLGSGKGTSVFSLIDELRARGYETQVEVLPSRIGDPPYLVADISKATRLLGWYPTHSSINVILDSMHQKLI